MNGTTRYKRPESVLVVVHTRGGKVLLLKRADIADFWQSVTGALRWDETDPREAAVRELAEETGIRARPQALRDLGLVRCFPILPEFRSRYASAVTHNVEHAFSLELSDQVSVGLSAEHIDSAWFAWDIAAETATSWTDRATIRALFAE